MEHPKVGQLWKNSKRGTLYKVLAIGKHSESLENLVVYEAQYDNKESKVWVRPLGMWTELIQIGGEMVPRFTLVEIIESE